jgi:GDP-4-dehydro-6-deoxy-D-mannose reductase
MRVLMTGAAGFVGPYVAEALAHIDRSAVIIATAREAGNHPRLGALLALDVTSQEDVKAALERHRPTHIINLAGIAATALANADARQTWRIHVNGVLSLARAVLGCGAECALINVGSGLVYGATAAKVSPLSEDALLDPLDEYAATKAAADLALGALSRRGLKCVRLRPFNHTGAGQSTDFAVPAFAMQIARIEASLAPPIVRVGNLDAERDFLDVRDVAGAYALAAARSSTLAPGTILNIASGVPRRMSDVLGALVGMSRVPIRIERDPQRLRPSDVPSIVGDASRARALLGWSPVHDFKDTLLAVLEDCRARVGGRA